ncbi:hypothetical protein [Actinomadura violacea]|uniref:Uncharacterized protein n=1 Tax=Actinomadura violacea TaxID=2819934 RepID=A0ABS3RR36_9ACTN|nr:hypothetical protein [Actinomadura violacea]MBO2458545.1 hypothetical protein [Actinomadura violacea]
MNGTSVTEIRGELHIDGRRLSYLDFGGPGRPLPALHGHLYEARAGHRQCRRPGLRSR